MAALLALAIGLGLGVTVLAALVPARAASRVTPLEAMRPQVGEVYERQVGRRAWVGLALGIASAGLLVTRTPELVGLGAVVFLVAIALVAPVIVNPLARVFGNVVELFFAREGAVAIGTPWTAEQDPVLAAATAWQFTGDQAAVFMRKPVAIKEVSDGA